MKSRGDFNYFTDEMTKNGTQVSFDATFDGAIVLDEGVWNLGYKSNAAAGGRSATIALQIWNGNAWVSLETPIVISSGDAIGTVFATQQVISDGGNVRISITGASGSGSITLTLVKLYN